MHFKRSRHSLYAGPRKEASSVRKQTESSLLYQPPHSCAMQSVKAARPHFLANHRRPAQTNAAQPTGLLPAISSRLPPYITLHRHCVQVHRNLHPKTPSASQPFYSSTNTSAQLSTPNCPSWYVPPSATLRFAQSMPAHLQLHG
jgi:hypothetical protein